MAEYQITLDDAQIQALLADTRGLAPVVEQVLNRIIAEQVTAFVQAGRYERTATRHDHRNGTRTRFLATRLGRLQLRVPRVRGGGFQPTVFARYQRSEQAFLATVMEMVVTGVSTRKVQRITTELCGTRISAMQVSRICQGLDSVVTAWRTRSLAETHYPVRLVDALRLKIREGGHVRAKSGLVVTGVTAEGYREILALEIGDSEAHATWGATFAGRKARGLTGVDLVVSDQHAGLVAAIAQHFQGATWQRCQTHFTRNILTAAPKAQQPALGRALRGVLTAPDRATADTLVARVHAQFTATAPKALPILDDGLEDALAILAYPEAVRVRLRTTNGVERLNEEIRRRERVIRIFPHDASALRLLGAVLLEIHEQWATGRRYLNPTSFPASWTAASPEVAQRPAAETAAVS